MRDEMTRSMAGLRMNGEPAPYYIEYEIDDIVSMRAIARLGGIVDDVTDHTRTLRGTTVVTVTRIGGIAAGTSSLAPSVRAE